MDARAIPFPYQKVTTKTKVLYLFLSSSINVKLFTCIMLTTLMERIPGQFNGENSWPNQVGWLNSGKFHGWYGFPLEPLNTNNIHLNS